MADRWRVSEPVGVLLHPCISRRAADVGVQGPRMLRVPAHMLPRALRDDITSNMTTCICLTAIRVALKQLLTAKGHVTMLTNGTMI
jgi:hypothetical protein